MGDFVVPEWMETAADREAREERERMAEQRLIQAQREAHNAAIRICSALVEELFVEKVHQIVYFKDMGIRSRKAAIEFAEAAVKHLYKDGISLNAEQDTKGGPMLHAWDPTEIPRREDMEKLEFERKVKGTWVEKARKNVVHVFESGQKTVVKQPRIVNTLTTFAGKGTVVSSAAERQRAKGPRADGLGPSWTELYVGQRVTYTRKAIERRELYRIRDSAGVCERRDKGDTIYKALMECTGIIIDAVEDMELQTNVTYAPVRELVTSLLEWLYSPKIFAQCESKMLYSLGKKTTNYVCYPGGGSYVRWDATKEVTFVWTDRLMPVEEGNEIDDIERRTDLIEAQNWAALDAETAVNKQRLNQLPEKFVLILRDKAMQARIRAHHARINRFSKEAIAERMKTPGGGISQMMANLHAKKPGGSNG